MEKVHGEEGGYHVFPSSFVCLTVLKRFVGEPLCNSENSGNEKLHAKERRGGGGITVLSIFFVSQ